MCFYAKAGGLKNLLLILLVYFMIIILFFAYIYINYDNIINVGIHIYWWIISYFVSI